MLGQLGRQAGLVKAKMKRRNFLGGALASIALLFGGFGWREDAYPELLRDEGWKPYTIEIEWRYSTLTFGIEATEGVDG